MLATVLCAILVWPVVPKNAIASDSNATSNLLYATLGRESFSNVSTIAILRINPWVGRVISVRPHGADTPFDDKAVIGETDRVGLGAIHGMVQNAFVSPGCYQHTGTAETFPVAWAVLFYRRDGTMMGDFYIDQTSLCVTTRGKLYSIGPDLVINLRRSFGFMNY